eukprot:1187949-Prorocentrum_minimum.AAC.2
MIGCRFVSVAAALLHATVGTTSYPKVRTSIRRQPSAPRYDVKGYNVDAKGYSVDVKGYNILPEGEDEHQEAALRAAVTCHVEQFDAQHEDGGGGEEVQQVPQVARDPEDKLVNAAHLKV